MRMMRSIGALLAAVAFAAPGTVVAQGAEVPLSANSVDAATAAKARPAKVRLYTTATRVKSGGKVTVYGTVGTAGGKRIARARVVVQRRAMGASKWNSVASRRTNSKGRFSVTRRNNVNYEYRAVVRGTSKYAKAISSSKRVTARQWIKQVSWDFGGTPSNDAWRDPRTYTLKVSPGLEGRVLTARRDICTMECPNTCTMECPNTYPIKVATKKVKNGTVKFYDDLGYSQTDSYGLFDSEQFRVSWPGTKAVEAVSWKNTEYELF